MPKSEFGQGLTYCLGLFLAHTEHIKSDLDSCKNAGISEESAYCMWFNGAADHLYEFLPEYAPKGLRKRCEIFKDFCMRKRLSIGDLSPATKEDYDWAVQEAKDLLRLIDKKNGIPVIKGEWE